MSAPEQAKVKIMDSSRKAREEHLLRQRSDEALIAGRASRLIGPRGPISPRVARTGDHRLVLQHVAGPRLNDALKSAGDEGTAMVRDAAAVLAHLHAAEAPVVRRATSGIPPWEPVPYLLYIGMTDPQRRIVAELHGDLELRRAGRRNDAAALAGDTWCHGDARSDNFVLAVGSPVLVDWECSGSARPELDLGMLLASLLVSALDAALRDDADVRGRVKAALAKQRSLTTAAMVGYRDAGGAGLDSDLLGARVGSALILQAFARSVDSSYDRITAMLLSIGVSLTRHPERWAALNTIGSDQQ
jgi:tRNA A-37 threonylcarbamoyl transferase component Bud32